MNIETVWEKWSVEEIMNAGIKAGKIDELNGVIHDYTGGCFYGNHYRSKLDGCDNCGVGIIGWDKV